MLKIVHPTVLWGVRAVPRSIGWVLLAVFAAAMAADLAATVRTVVRMNRQLRQLDELAGRLREVSNDLGERLAGGVLAGAEAREDVLDSLDQLREAAERRRAELRQNVEEVRDDLAQRRFQLRLEQAEWLEERERDLDELRARFEEARSRRIFGQRRLLAAFPGLRSLDHRGTLERLRRWLEQR